MTPETLTPAEKRLQRRVIAVCAFMTLCFVTLCLGVVFPVQMGFQLVIGWTSYIARALPVFTISVERTTWFLVALILFTLGIHFVCKKRYRRKQASKAESGESNWRLRWTLSLAMMCLMLALSGICVISMTHQTWWMVTGENMVAYRRGMMAARRSTSKNNLRQIGLAMHDYHESNSQLPMGGTFDQTGQPHHSWTTRLVPYLDQAELYNQIDFHQSWTAEANQKAFQIRIPAFQNPGLYSDYDHGKSSEEVFRGYKPIHYAANSRVFNVNSGLTFKKIPDGTSNTIFAGEVKAGIKAWGDPLNFRDPVLGINVNPHGFGGPFTGGTQVLMGDGSARFISDDIDPAVLKAISTPNGGEAVGEF